MLIAGLVLLGLVLGSFANALVWRLHEQEIQHSGKRIDKKYLARLSIKSGRSMCPHCKHDLAVMDLVPVLSWLSLRGKCRYCKYPISVQYPLVELCLALVFLLSYVYWPASFTTSQEALFGLWLVLVTGLAALLVYDLRWMVLPNRIIYPLSAVALLIVLINVLQANNHPLAVLDEVLGVVIGGGIFYLLFQVSNGKWIGGGDVRLGWLLGLVAGTAFRASLLIFIAACLGSLVSLPLLVNKQLKAKSRIPFGPFLIIAVIVVQLFGGHILSWYQNTFLEF